MSGTDRPVSDDELHAWVDLRLSPDRTDAVLHFLRANPEQAERVEGWRRQRDALRSALAEYDAGPVPPRLNPHVLMAHLATRRRVITRVAAAAVLAFGLGGAAGWLLRGPADTSHASLDQLIREAVANHVVYTADRRRPTELGPDQRDDLARWVSNRLNRPVSPPDLSSSGFAYIGGRLAATPEGPAGLFMYQNDKGIRLTVFVRPDARIPNAPPAPAKSEPVGGYAWAENGMGYMVVAPVPQDELRSLAETIQKGTEPRS